MRVKETPMDAEELMLQLKFLAAMALQHPHINTDGIELGLDDADPRAWCLACTVGQLAEMCGVDVIELEDEPEATEAVIANYHAYWDEIFDVNKKKHNHKA